MFPPMTPMGERIRHQVETEQMVKRAPRGTRRLSFSISRWFSGILTFRRPEIARPNIRATQEVEAC
jgi:hypothetical protein